MSYRIFGGVHDILSNIDDLKALGPNQREKGQIIAVKDGDYRVYIWDPTATAKALLCSLAGEDPVNTSWPSKASTWYPELVPSVFEERTHMVEEDNVRFENGSAVREDFGYLFVVPNDISGGTSGTNNYTDIQGRWVVMNYATLIDNIPWDLRAGHLIPRYNNTFDFGNPEHKVRDFYLSDATMWLGDEHKISIDQAGDLKFQKRKIGKIPENLESHAVSSRGSLGNGNKLVLELIKGNPFISSPEVDELSVIDESTAIPSELKLNLGDWIQVAKDAGLYNASPSTLFGESDFEDALSLGAGDSGGGTSTIDPSNVGGYDLGIISGKIENLEGKFPGGVLAEAHIDENIFRLADFADKFTERMTLEGDIIRNGNFANKFDEVFGTKGAITNDNFGNKFAEKIAEETDLVRDITFQAKFDASFATKDVMTSEGFGPLFDTRLASKDVNDLLDAGNRLLTNGQKTAITANSEKATFPGFETLTLSDVESALGTTKSSMLNSNVDLSSYATTAALALKQDAGDYLTTSSTIGADKITGTLASDRIPNLNASKITAGTLSASRISSTITRNSQLTSYATTATVDALDTRVGTAEGTIGSNTARITGNATSIADKQDASALDTDIQNWIQGNLSIGGNGTDGTVNLKIGTDIINSTNATWLNNYVNNNSTLAGRVTTTEGTIATNATNISNAASDASTALAGVTSLDTWKANVFSEGSGNLAIDKLPFSLFGDTGTFKGTLGSTAKLADGVTTLSSNLTSLSNEISGLQTTVTTLDSSFTYTPLVTNIYTVSDKDLKNIIRIVPQSEVTSDYHLIGLTTVEYEWKPIANTLFGYSGHVQEGFIAEELETLFPAPDPQNLPTSIDDGHIWWHEYTTEEQKESDSSVHNYYTLVNTALLQAEIDAAIANL